jgi:hypothetical protein
VKSFIDQLVGANDELELELSVLPAVNFALVHNRVPVLRNLSLRSTSDKPLQDLAVSVELHGHSGTLAEPWHREVPVLDANEGVVWADLGEFAPHAHTLSQCQEAFNATLEVTASHPWGQPLRVAGPLRVLAHNEWLANPALFDTIAAFVQPNTHAVAEILREATEILRSTSGDTAIVGYQRGPERAIETAGAIYEALRNRDLAYSPAPSSFENTGQKVRTSPAVLDERLGNCIDLAVTYAACLEQADLRPLICITEGHAFAAFHRDDERLPESVLLDANSIVNLIDTGHLIPVETVGISSGSESRPFPKAVSAGQSHFQNVASLRGLVDVHLAHKSGIDPLPSADDDGPGMPAISTDAPARVPPSDETTSMGPGTNGERAADRGLSADSVSLPEDLRSTVLGDGEEIGRVYQVDGSAPARIEKWRQGLLDLSLRNPLLHLPRSGRRGLDLHVPAGALAVLDDLVHAHKSLRVHSIDDLTSLRDLRDDTEVAPETLVDDLRDKRRIYGAVSADSYRNTMRTLQRSARTMEQETGSNYLYLTLGALVHPRPSGGEARAPLFLIPMRIEGGSGKAPYRLLVDGQELAAPNYCLVEWLRVKHEATIPQLSEPILDDSGIDITRTLAAIKQGLVEHQLNYRVDELASLRLLQFSTFQMWRDLTDHWQEFMTNPVVEHLVERPGQAFEDPAGDGEALAVDEADLHLPIPADGSQMEAITMAEAGRSFVLEGPPGTGKSQTITNLITRLIARDQTVLFVAEKQAALDVVKRRIESLGLTPFVLDLHGRRQTMRSIREQLRRSFDHQIEGDEVGWQAAALDFSGRLAPLRSYPESLHEPNKANFSAWAAYDSLLAYGDGPALEVPRALMDQGPEIHQQIESNLEAMPEKIRTAQPRARHPWSLIGRRSFDGIESDNLLSTASALEESRQKLEHAPLLKEVISGLESPEEIDFLASYLDHANPGDAVTPEAVELTMKSDWDGACSAVVTGLRDLRERHSAVIQRFVPAAFNSELLTAWVSEAEAASRGLFGKRRRQEALIAKLAPYLQPGQTVANDELPTLIEALRVAAAEASVLSTAARELPGMDLPPTWSAIDPDAIEVLQASIGKLTSAREVSQRAPDSWRTIVQLSRDEPSSLPLSGVLAETWRTWQDLLAATNETISQWADPDGWFQAWANDGPDWKQELESESLRPLRAWAIFQSALDDLREVGMTSTVNEILSGGQSGEELLASFRRGQARTALDERLSAHGLDLFDGEGRNHEVERYISATNTLRSRVATQMASEMVHRRRAAEAAERKRFGELKKQLDRKRGGMSFRELFLEYGQEILKITPCILMSPASVATFLSPDATKFDVAVFDEASQIRVPQAIGALGRSRAAVIVGDSRQMPPTSVMEVSRDDEQEDSSVPEDLESILSEAVESGLGRQWLSWHYRSRVEDLIAFSNRHYYDSRLSTLPSPGPVTGAGVSWRRVDGTFARGGTRTNEVEADAIVEEICTRLKADPHTKESIGVVTFNVQQRDLILNKLEEREDELLQAALAREDGEAIFVKNLENVQGDERDTILFSLAFSKDPSSGNLPLNFGPLLNQGGERRLNVAVTRARSCVVLFSSFDPHDIDLRRTNSVGLAHLRAYMELAAGGVERLGDLRDGSAHHSERLMEELSAELERRGLEIGRRIGLSDFRVDLAARKPGNKRWQVAVLSDGPNWASRPTVADRNGAPAILPRMMGWSACTMVWLPEWVRNREIVVERIVGLVNEADREAEEHETAVRTEAVAAIQSAGSASESTPTESGTEPPEQPAVPQPPHEKDSSPVDDGVLLSPLTAAPFVPFQPREVGTRGEIDQLSHSERVQTTVRTTLQEVAEREGPIQIDRLVRLTLNCFGFNRVAGDRGDALAPLVPKERCVSSPMGTYVWPNGVDAASWRGYRATQQSGDRAFAEVCPEEVGNAMLHVLTITPAPLQDEELYRRAMTALGYRRLTDGIHLRLNDALAIAIQSGKVGVTDDGRYRPGV